MAQHYSFFHSTNQKIASSQAGAWVMRRILHHIDRLVFRLSGRRATFTSWLAGVPVVMVTTRGARSGLPRSLPLMCIGRDPASGTFALVASNFGQHPYPAWYYNLKADPHATCNLRGQTDAYLAREAVDAEYERYWQLAQGAYLGFPLYKARASHRRIPIMVLSPQREEAG